MTQKILFITEVIDLGKVYYRQGESFARFRTYEVEAMIPKETVLHALSNEFDEGYPCDKGYDHAYIAVTNETDLLILRIIERDETVSPQVNNVEFIIYIKGFGWYKISKNEIKRLEPLSSIPSGVEWRILDETYQYP